MPIKSPKLDYFENLLHNVLHKTRKIVNVDLMSVFLF